MRIYAYFCRVTCVHEKFSYLSIRTHFYFRMVRLKMILCILSSSVHRSFSVTEQNICSDDYPTCWEDASAFMGCSIETLTDLISCLMEILKFLNQKQGSRLFKYLTTQNNNIHKYFSKESSRSDRPDSVFNM